VKIDFVKFIVGHV